MDLVVPVCNVRVDVCRGRRRLWTERGHNLVPTSGRNLIRDRLDGSAEDPLSHFALGDDNTAASNNDTALGNEVFRAAFTATTADVLKLTIQYFLAPGSANGETLREAGLFNDATAGTLYARYVIGAPITKTSAVSVTFTWELSWTVTAMQATERGEYFHFGGDEGIAYTGDAYDSGATFDNLAGGTTPLYVDSANLAGGTFVLEVVMRVGAGTTTPTACLVNLDDGSPDTPLTGSEVSGSVGNTTGERVRSGAITFPSAGAAKQLGVKVKTDEVGGEVYLHSARLIRTS